MGVKQGVAWGCCQSAIEYRQLLRKFEKFHFQGKTIALKNLISKTNFNLIFYAKMCKNRFQKPISKNKEVFLLPFVSFPPIEYKMLSLCTHQIANPTLILLLKTLGTSLLATSFIESRRPSLTLHFTRSEITHIITIFALR